MPHRKPINLVLHAPQSERGEEEKRETTCFSPLIEKEDVSVPFSFCGTTTACAYNTVELKLGILLSPWQGEALRPQLG